MAGRYDGSIRIDSSIDSKGFDKGIAGMSKSIKALGAALAIAFSVKVIAGFTAESAKLAAEWERLAFSAQAVGQINGISAKKTRELVQELRESGIQSDTANRSFINFAKDGLDTSLLPALAAGAQDLATFANTGETSSDMLDRLTQGILTMNSLMLRNAKVSVDIEEAQKAYGETIGKTTSQMTIQEKRHGVMLAVMERLKSITGLYELSQKTVAGQMASNVRVTNDLKDAIGSPFQDALFKLIKAWNTMLKAMTRAISVGGALRSTFVNIGAVASILAEIIAKLFMAIASLFGYEASAGGGGGTMESLADGGQAAAAGQDALAESTEKAGKAAKGALASFDDLNVLQKDTAGAGAGADAGAGLDGLVGDYGEINVDDFVNPMDEIIAKADELKEKIANNKFFIAFSKLFEAIGKVLSSAWEAIMVTFKPAWDWFVENVLGDIDFGQLLVDAIDWLTKKLEELSKWIGENKTAFTIILIVLTAVALIMSGVGISIGIVIAVIAALIFILANAGKAWEIMKSLAVLAWNIIAKLWGKAKEWFKSHVTDPIKDAFKSSFETIESIVKGVINKVIDFMNTMIDGIVSGINTIIGAANTVSSILPGSPSIGYISATKIPYLATGAVIPPNAQFAAILGDQKSGRNLEAPENLIRQIVREESGGGGEQKITIEFSGSMAELVRMLNPEIKKDNARIGKTLISGAIA